MQVLTHVRDPEISAVVARLGRHTLTELIHLPDAALSGDAFVLGTPDALGKVLIVDLDDGTLDLLAHLRALGHRTPILSIIHDRARGHIPELLRAGADDVLTPPIEVAEFKARLSALSRRCFDIACDVVEVGEMRAYLDGRDPEVAGQTVSLTRREQDILRVLALNVGRMVTKDGLYRTLYGMLDEPPLSKVVEVHVCTLRKKLAEASTTGWSYIETVKRRGYQLTTPT